TSQATSSGVMDWASRSSSGLYSSAMRKNTTGPSSRSWPRWLANRFGGRSLSMPSSSMNAAYRRLTSSGGRARADRVPPSRASFQAGYSSSISLTVSAPLGGTTTMVTARSGFDDAGQAWYASMRRCPHALQRLHIGGLLLLTLDLADGDQGLADGPAELVDARAPPGPVVVVGRAGLHGGVRRAARVVACHPPACVFRVEQVDADLGRVREDPHRGRLHQAASTPRCLRIFSVSSRASEPRPNLLLDSPYGLPRARA